MAHILGAFSPRAIREFMHVSNLPAQARAEIRADAGGWPQAEVSPHRAVDAGLVWLAAAQDNSASEDGGCARHYSLVGGWSPSYPETTGYIIPTLLDIAYRRRDFQLRDRAKRMLDWLVSIQMPEGGFQGGMIGQRPVVPVTFNTGQILMGLAAGEAHLGGYAQAMHKAATWLAESIDEDGCWRAHPTPFAAPGEKVYETHVAWGLMEAARLAPDRPYGEAARRNLDWAARWQHDNGWFDKCCLIRPDAPLTHTLGYALRGFVEGWVLFRDPRYLDVALRAATGLLRSLDKTGRLPGRLHSDWSPAVSWSCLTGNAQIAHCWLMLYLETGETRFRDAGLRANAALRRTIRLDGPEGLRGGVKGSFPVGGDYGRYEYLNWACKFMIDSCLLEMDILAAEQ